MASTPLHKLTLGNRPRQPLTAFISPMIMRIH